MATEKLVYTIDEAAQVLCISRVYLYSLIHSRKLQSYTVGKRRFVSSAAIMAFIASRELAEVRAWQDACRLVA